MAQDTSRHTIHIIAVDNVETHLAAHSNENPQTQTSPENLAYVIYTSGSTGQPKGVMVHHMNVVAMLYGFEQIASKQNRLVGTSVCPYGFDVSVWEFFSMLCFGGSLHLLTAEIFADSVRFAAYIAMHSVTSSYIPPALLRGTVEACEQLNMPITLDRILVGVEPIKQGILQRFRDLSDEMRIVNGYGPTESTICATFFSFQQANELDCRTPIGKSVAGYSVYVLSEFQQPVSIGMHGELYIGGAGLARGYLNRPELTAERFIEHPEFGRLYKTGDLCRWLPDGNIEYIGRTDFQVKIRGFRIELGEIENALLAQAGVREAVVLAREYQAGDNRLVAYLVGEAETETLRQALAQRLPEYMIPSAFVKLEAMPLTPNGKLDRRALPAPDYAEHQATFVAPRNEVEATLSQVFAEVLRVSQVGIHDNFFRMGGDSILSIQLVSRVAQQGYPLRVKDIFQSPTVAQLAGSLHRARVQVSASQEVQSGVAPLLPIQRWFLEMNQPAMHHFNQSFLLTVNQSIELVQLEAAISALVSHHDALRFCYTQGAAGWQQRYLAPRISIPLQRVDLQGMSQHQRLAEIEAIGTQSQASLNPLTGDLVRFVYFKMGRFDAGEEGRLLIVIHHLAVDGVSWRILLEDLTTLLDGGQLPAKTSSYREWGELLQSATAKGAFDADIRRWLTKAEARPLPLDEPAAANTESNSHHLSLTLSGAQTDRLLRTLPDRQGVTLDAVLLTALTETLAEWSGQTALVVRFESYGRQELAGHETIDLNRTVGWFTSTYPLTIQRFAGSALKRIRYTLDTLRQVADGGISFGALQHFHPDAAIHQQFTALPKGEVVYNYLGQMDSLANHRFALAPESAGLAVSPTFQRDTLLDSNAVVVHGQLQIDWTVSPQLYRETAETLLAAFAQRLDTLIAEALLSVEWVPIRTDFPDANLSCDELDTLLQKSTLQKSTLQKSTLQKSTLCNDLSTQSRQAIQNVYTLSPMQAGMLFHSQLAPKSGTYLEHTLFHVQDATFHPAQMVAAIQQVIDRHDNLRATFEGEGYREAVQVIHAQAQLPITYLDWRNYTAEEYQTQFAQLVAHDRLIDFDFTHAPLLRLTVLEHAAHGYDLLFTFHHILMDRWSFDIFWAEVLCAYARQPLPQATPYQRYIHHLRQQPDDSSFWRDYLRGFLAATPLPGLVTTMPAQGTPHSLVQTLSLATTQQLTTFAREQGVTVNTLFQAAWALLLARYTGETDVVFGMVTSGRTAPIPGIEAMVGLLINTLPFRVQLHGALTAVALLQRMSHTQLELQQREHTALVDIQRWSEVPAGSSLFESLFLFQNTPQSTAQIAHKLDVRPGQVEPGATGYPLLALAAPGEAITLVLSYDTARYDADTVARLLTHWQQLLLGIVTQPDQPVLQLPMLTAAEYHEIVHEWNDTAVDFGPPQTIHALFEAQVARTPDAVAVIADFGFTISDFGFPAAPSAIQNPKSKIQNQLTYAELNARANQLAHYLLEYGIGANGLVGICVERSLEMVIGLLGILKAGGAYVPLDPSLPHERLAFLFVDAKLSIVVSDKKLADKLPCDSTVTILDFDSIFAVSTDTTTPMTPTTVNDRAYVIYTSGSTGQPKGVEGLHRATVNRLQWMWATFPFEMDEVCCAKTTLPFVDAVAEIFGPLLRGFPLLIADDATTKDPYRLVSLLAFHQVTRLVLVPSLLRLFLETFPDLNRRLPKLRLWVSSGEALSPQVCQSFYEMMPGRILLNVYGSSEVAADVTVYQVSEQIAHTTHASVPIGRPIANTQAYILDRSLQPVLIGSAGELYIGGIQVARGYLNRPELTAERFIEHAEFGRLYKTGDLCCWLADGNIEYIGRTDFQVKIRGFRIELGEIENALLAQPGVREAVVLAREYQAGDNRLVTYLVGEADPETLRQALGQRLPEYMIPSAFVTLETMPLTPNGKLDRRALPAPDYAAASAQHVPPETLAETQLTLLWQSVLGVQPIGVEDNFFALGGHSLLATQLVQRMSETLQHPVSLQQLFKTPTIRSLLRGLTEVQSTLTSFVPLRTSGKQSDGKHKHSPLFLLPPAGGLVFPYRTLLPYLASAQPIYALQARGIYNDLPPFESLAELACATIQEMKSIQPHGPYTLAGWSFGGMVAFEIARQLLQQGEAVAFLGVIDSYPYAPDPTAGEEMLTPQAELQAFVYLLGDVMGSDYRNLQETLFVDALEHQQPLAWLLDEISRQGHRLVMEPAIIQRIWQTLQHNVQLMQAYQPQPYGGRITLFCAEESAPADGSQRWQALTPQPIETVWVSGEHQTMLNAAKVEKLGRELEMRLQAVDGG
jgi:amino acid adenylation domain-containing protein/non-ribosomal peptide synthase protein (TIGR01720 family)